MKACLFSVLALFVAVTLTEVGARGLVKGRKRKERTSKTVQNLGVEKAGADAELRPFGHPRHYMPEPAVGVEPTTSALRKPCSAVEPRWRFDEAG